MSAVQGLLDALLRSSLQGAVFIGLVWMVCRLFPRLPASVRCGLWWLACLKLLIGLVWISPVELPLLPAAPARPAPVAVVQVASPPPSGAPLPAAPPVSMSWQDGARAGLAALWLAGLFAVSLKAALQLRHTRWVIRRSEPLSEGWIRTAFAELCARLSLRRRPGLLGSGDVRTPQAIGLVRPWVVLPRTGLDKLSPSEVSMTLCHELLHLRRGDLWWGWVPALAHRIFFFHPLAALAAREYVIAREAACDAEVIRVLGSAPQAYGRLLLRWGVAPRETGLAAAGASPSLENLKRRLRMLEQSSVNKRRVPGWYWLAGAMILAAGLVPLRIVAQEPAPEAPEAVAVPEPAEAPEAEMAAEPAEAPEAEMAPEAETAPEPGEAPEALPAPQPLPAPEAPPAPRAVPAVAPRALQEMPTPRPRVAPRPMPAVPPAPPAPAPRAVPAVHSTPLPPGAPRAVAPLPPAPTPRPAGLRQAPPPPPPAPPAPPKPPSPPKGKGSYSYSFSTSDHGDSWIYLQGNGSATMSGDLGDLEKLKKLRGSSQEDILWYRHAGKAYVVRDAATLKKAQEIFRPQVELGVKQGELGAKQGELGGKQGELGAKQGALGAEMGALAAERARRGDGDDRDLDRRQEAAEKKMDELSRLQDELGRKQDELGKKQDELGRLQDAAAEKAERDLKILMDQAIASGKAQTVR